MDRKIKFRVWNTRKKEFFCQGDDERLDLALEYWELNKHVCYPQQFTGLLDKNGKEIYEGDCFIGYDGKTWCVEMNDGCWALTGGNWSNPSLSNNSVPLYLYVTGLEVSGNIYQTPEKLTA